jgi:PERQ amino acid-rich with GYF domain-containing protein
VLGRPGTIQNDPHGRPLGQGSPFINDGVATFTSHLPGNAAESYPQYGFLGQGSFQAAPEQQQYLSSELNGNEHNRTSTLGFRGVNDEIVASPTPQHDTVIPSVSSPWKTVAEPVQTSQTVVATVTASSVAHTTSVSLQSPWGPVEDVTSESTVAPIISPTNDEASPTEAVTASKHVAPEAQIPTGYAQEKAEPVFEDIPPSEAVAKPAQPSGKASRKSAQVVQPPAPVSEPTSTDVSSVPVAPKAPWAKEDEGKKKNAAPSFSLREIQEAEAQKLEAKKAAEREKERLSRASVTTDSKEETQPFIASWGLPTSQAGVRGSTPLREAAPVPAPASGASPVWTTPAKAPAVKKTMKEIQEEEETRKKLTAKEALASAAAIKRGYAETTIKVRYRIHPGSILVV